MKNKTQRGAVVLPQHKPRQKRLPPDQQRKISDEIESIAGFQRKGVMFSSLVKVLHALIDFENAFILQMQDDQSMQTVASTSERLRGVTWKTGPLFMRVLSGIPVSSPDISGVSEWACQSETVRKDISSALHITLSGGRLAILVITHSTPGFFGPAHIRLMTRFAPLASQALLSLDLQRAVIQRDRFFQLSMDLMGIVDYRGNFKQFNESWKTLLGYRPEAFYSNRLFSFVHQDDVQLFIDAVRQLIRTGEQCLVEGRFRCENGSYCWLSCSLAAYLDEKLCYIVARDVTDRVLVEQQLAYDSRHDPLTGLYNRIEFMERLDIAFARSVRERNYTFAIFYMDLNGFKTVNDTLGHDIGDALLKEVSRCLLDVVREVDTVARFGGDEFTILLDGIKSRDQMVMIIDRIHEKLLNPFILRDMPVSTSVSIGVTLSSEIYKNAAHMLRDADSAMYKAKTEKNLPYVLINNTGCPGKGNKRRRR